MKKYIVMAILIIVASFSTTAFALSSENDITIHPPTDESDEVVQYATKADLNKRFNSISNRMTRLEKAIKSIGSSKNVTSTATVSKAKITKAKKAKVVPRKAFFKSDCSRDDGILTALALCGLLLICFIVLWYRNARQHRTFQPRA